MSITQLDCELSQGMLPLFQACCEAIGSVATTVLGPEDEYFFQRHNSDMPDWTKVRFLAYFDTDQSFDELRHFLEVLLEPKGLPEIHWSTLEETDWQALMQASFKPISIRDALWICPTWCVAPAAPDKILWLDPGLAFGTGSHPSTRLCLEWLLDNAPLEKTVIDYGCGSGVLSLASARLQAHSIYAVDSDSQALRVTAENCTLNQLAPGSVQTAFPYHLPQGLQADVIVANILLETLVELEPEFSNLLKPGGSLVMSGLLGAQVKELESAYSAHFENFEVRQLEAWALVKATRRLAHVA